MGTNQSQAVNSHLEDNRIELAVVAQTCNASTQERLKQRGQELEANMDGTLYLVAKNLTGCETMLWGVGVG